MADTPSYTGVTYENDYFRKPDESMYDFMMRLAKLRATGVLGGGGMLNTAPVIEEQTTESAPVQATNLGVVQSNSSGSLSDGQKRVSSGKPVLDANGNPVLDAQGNPVMGTMVVNEPKQEMDYRTAVNVAANNTLMPSDVLGKAGPVGSLLGIGADYLVERDAISKAAEYLGVTEDDVATLAALDDASAVDAALEQGMLGFKPNTDTTTAMKIAKGVMQPFTAVKDFAKEALFGTPDLSDYKMENQLNMAIMQEAANKAGMFSGAMKGMTHPYSNITDRNPITGAGTAMIDGKAYTYSPGMLASSNINAAPVVASVFNPAAIAQSAGAISRPAPMPVNFLAQQERNLQRTMGMMDTVNQLESGAISGGDSGYYSDSSGSYTGGSDYGGWTGVTADGSGNDWDSFGGDDTY